MEENEMLEQTNETENTETQTVEENEEGIELTDTTDADEANVNEPEKEEVKPSLRELLKDNPDYQEELNEFIVKPRLARQDREHQKEISKYKDTENVLRSALKVEETEDVNAKLREYYESEGIKLPSRYEPGLSSREVEALANLEANDIIEEGTQAMTNEANRLAGKGYENLNQKERIIFDKLCAKLTSDKNKAELKSLGAKEDLLTDEKFNNFRKKFNSNVPIKEIYEMYMNSQPKPKVENPGSMKSGQDKTVKDFYSFEEASKITREELDKNPELVKIIEASMSKW